MSLWLVRAGKHGEFETKFLEESRLYVTWAGLGHDLSKLADKKALRDVLRSIYPHAGEKRVINNSGQIWPFAHEMKPGDLVVVPSKLKAAIHIAEIAGPYQFEPKGPDPYFHWRKVNWLLTDIPRSSFDQDLLYSFGAFMSICEIQRNDAEKRVRTIVSRGRGGPSQVPKSVESAEKEADSEELFDIEQAAKDGIASLISAKFKGHGLARLVEAILKAQGYATYLSPPGPDKGIDILAGSGPLGFGDPRLCVQVKSSDEATDAPTLHQLIGSMQNVGATQGLFVSWGGFKSSVYKEEAAQFFRVRLWDQQTLIDQLLAHYDRLDEDLKTELPLKRIWTIAMEDEA